MVHYYGETKVRIVWEQAMNNLITNWPAWSSEIVFFFWVALLQFFQELGYGLHWALKLGFEVLGLDSFFLFFDLGWSNFDGVSVALQQSPLVFCELIEKLALYIVFDGHMRVFAAHLQDSIDFLHHLFLSNQAVFFGVVGADKITFLLGYRCIYDDSFSDSGGDTERV